MMTAISTSSAYYVLGIVLGTVPTYHISSSHQNLKLSDEIMPVSQIRKQKQRKSLRNLLQCHQHNRGWDSALAGLGPETMLLMAGL